MNAAEKLMETMNRELEEHAYVTITVTSICEKSQVSRPTFYHHFLSLADLVLKSLKHRLDTDVYPFETWEDWLDHTRELLEYMRENHNYFVHAFDRDVRRASSHYFDRILSEFIEEREQALDHQLAPEEKNFICGIYSGVIVSLHNEYIATDMALDPDFLVSQYNSLLVGSIDRAIQSCMDAK